MTGRMTTWMPVVVDHIFICTAVGAPGADQLRAFGLVEGSPIKYRGIDVLYLLTGPR